MTGRYSDRLLSMRSVSLIPLSFSDLRSGGEKQTCSPGDLHAEILSKMSAKEQMSKMLDQLLGQNRDGEFVHGFVFDSKQCM